MTDAGNIPPLSIEDLPQVTKTWLGSPKTNSMLRKIKRDFSLNDQQSDTLTRVLLAFCGGKLSGLKFIESLAVGANLGYVKARQISARVVFEILRPIAHSLSSNGISIGDIPVEK